MIFVQHVKNCGMKMEIVNKWMRMSFIGVKLVMVGLEKLIGVQTVKQHMNIMVVVCT
jgi:hypothetical protein